MAVVLIKNIKNKQNSWKFWHTPGHIV